MLNFLRHVLPSEGYKVRTVITPNSVVRNTFYQTTEQLVSALLEAENQGNNVYFACSTFKSTESRKKENVLGAKSFWLDLDAGIDPRNGKQKEYPNAQKALQALDDFTNKLGVSFPTAICSGYGIHGWFTMDDFVHGEEWLVTAKKFKEATERLGLKADPSRTADPASILRAPHNLNWKDPANPAQVYVEGDLEDPINFAEFNKAIDDCIKKFVPVTSAPASSLNANILGGLKTGGKPDMKQGFPDGQRTEALKKRAGWLLGPGGLTEEETLAACRGWNQFNTPPMDDAKLVHDVHSYAMREAAQRPQVQMDTNGLPRLPKGFFWGKNGELFTRTNAEGEDPKVIPISLSSVYLMDVCRDEHAKTKATSYIFNQYHPKSGWEQYSISGKTLFGSNGFAELVDRGTDILTSGQKAFKNYVHQAAHLIKATKEDSMRYEQFGWKNNRKGFLVGKHLFKEGAIGPEIAYGTDKVEQRMGMMGVAKGGTLAGWSSYANKLFVKGCEAQGFGLLTSLAAPFIFLAMGDQGEGGSILSLYSPESGRGKTTTLDAIASVWGEVEAIRIIDADTYVAKFGTISVLCNLPVIFEELDASGDPKFLIDFTKQFTSGRDRARGQKDGSVNPVMKQFQTMLISASNGSLLNAVSADQGAAARVFEITLELPEGFSLSHDKDISAGLAANNGYAGRAIIQASMQPGVMDQLRKTVKELIQYYTTALGVVDKPDYRYIVWMFAVNHAIGMLANHYGILQFDIDRIMSWAVARAIERISDRPTNNAVDTLKAIINENIMDCLVVDNPPHPKKPCTTISPFKRALKMRFEKNTSMLYISADAMREWLRKANKPLHVVFKQLEDMEVLLNRNSMRALAAGTEWNSAATACWKIDMNHEAMGGIPISLVDISVKDQAVG